MTRYAVIGGLNLFKEPQYSANQNAIKGIILMKKPIRASNVIKNV